MGNILFYLWFSTSTYYIFPIAGNVPSEYYLSGKTTPKSAKITQKQWFFSGLVALHHIAVIA